MPKFAFLIATMAIVASYPATDVSAADDTDTTECARLSEIDCTPKRDCTPPHDTRECNRCVLSVFGHCNIHANDPACEAAKAAQNQLYATQNAACEALKARDRAECESAKEALQVSCQPR